MNIIEQPRLSLKRDLELSIKWEWIHEDATRSEK